MSPPSQFLPHLSMIASWDFVINTLVRHIGYCAKSVCTHLQLFVPNWNEANRFLRYIFIANANHVTYKYYKYFIKNNWVDAFFACLWWNAWFRLIILIRCRTIKKCILCRNWVVLYNCGDWICWATKDIILCKLCGRYTLAFLLIRYSLNGHTIILLQDLTSSPVNSCTRLNIETVSRFIFCWYSFSIDVFFSYAFVRAD